VREHIKAPEGREVETPEEGFAAHGFLPFMQGFVDIPPYVPGRLDADAGRCAMEWVRDGVRLAMGDEADAIVTGPINKMGIHAAGYTTPGHTEFIAELTGAPEHRMSLFSATLRIVHVTGHRSLRDALDALSIQRIADTIRTAHGALIRLALPHRRIGVAGVNPHAGEDGAFGTEEKEFVAPAIAQCQAEGITCDGPFSPDTVFKRMRDGEFDAVVAMYHDQGHIPAKLVDMESGVNVTLGLPIVRTSVDHGTAYEIAGKGVASESSLLAAVKLAAEFVSAVHVSPPA
jgi:4-hydroxythreonine-4-phosphate dehydrogenase